MAKEGKIPFAQNMVLLQFRGECRTHQMQHHLPGGWEPGGRGRGACGFVMWWSFGRRANLGSVGGKGSGVWECAVLGWGSRDHTSQIRHPKIQKMHLLQNFILFVHKGQRVATCPPVVSLRFVRRFYRVKLFRSMLVVVSQQGSECETITELYRINNGE